MKNIIKVLGIAILSIGLVVVFGLYANKVNKNKYTEFKDAGYVINTNFDKNTTVSGESASADVSSTKYYFDGNAKYSKNYNDEYKFSNTSKQEVVVSKENFIHYNDESIGAFKKIAILDLEHIDDKIIKYYTLPDKNVLTKGNKGYLAKNVSDNVEFVSFILKISENKYMIVAPNIDVSIKGEVKNFKNTYLELQYFDGDIVRLENSDTKIQNISEEFYINVGDNIIIDLSNKNIYLNKEKKLNLNEITIESDDNINLSGIDEDTTFMTEKEKEESKKKAEEEAEESIRKEKEEIEEAKNKAGSTGNASINTQNPLNGIADGNVGIASTDTSEEIVTENNDYDPVFSVSEFEVTASSVYAKFAYEDPSGVLSDAPTISLIDAGNNKVLDTLKVTGGITEFTYENGSLNQNTNYVLVVNSDYTKNGETLNKDFIQKSFMTTSIGVSVEKDYFSTKSLNFVINKENDSDVRALTARLYDKSGNVLRTEEIQFNGNSQNLSFTGLSPNKEYKLEVTDFLYNNTVISENFAIIENYKTLKRTPVVSNIDFNIDKVHSKFVLTTNNINDKDSGLLKLRYEVYDARTLSVDGNAEPVKVVDSPSLGSVDITVDDDIVERGVPYVFKVIAVFNDNEKEIEYETPFSDIMQLDGKVHPSVRFESENVTFERISGIVNIVDKYGTVDYGKPVTIVYTDSHGISKTETFSNVSPRIPIDINGLRANNETYTFDVYGTVDLNDGYGAVNQLIGTFTVNTSDIKSFLLESEVLNDDSMAFKVNAKLTSVNGEDNELEANTLSNLTFNLYSGKDTSGRKLKSISFTDRNLEPYESDLKSTYYDNEFTITPQTFGVTNNYLKSYESLTIEVTNANDYTIWPNTSPIINNTITLDVNDYVDGNNNPEKITITYIRNKNAGDHRDSALKDDTIVGISAKSTYLNEKKTAKSISYYLYDVNNPNTPIAKAENLPIGDDGVIPSQEWYLNYGTPQDTNDTEFRRGNTYFVTYVINVQKSDGTISHIPASGADSSENISIEKQMPVFYTYPSTMNGNELVWAYKYTDIDHALTSNKIFYKLNNIDIASYDISEQDSFQNLRLNLQSSGTVGLFTYVKLLKKNTTDEEKRITLQDISSIIEAPLLRYVITEETNRILITVPNYTNYLDYFNKVTSVAVEFVAGNKKKVIDDLTLDESGNIVVDLSSIEELIGNTVTVNLYAYYDSNLIGFDTDKTASGIYTNKFVLKEATNDNTGGTGIYYVPDVNRLSKSPIAYLSEFEFTLNKNANLAGNHTISITDRINTDKSYNLALDSGGFKFTDNNEYIHFYPSKIAKLDFTCENNTFEFNELIPSISLTENNKYLIDAEIDNASVTIKSISNKSSIRNNTIFLKLYKTDVNQLSSELVYEKAISIDDINEPIILDGLDPSSYYYFTISAITDDSGVKKQLYDIDQKNDTTRYSFETLGTLDITNSRIYYSADSYDKKKLIFDYTLNSTKSIDHISYSFYEVNYDNNGNPMYTLIPESKVKINDDIVPRTNMEAIIPIPPSSDINTSKNYAVGVKGYLKKSNGSIYELEEVYSNIYNFSKLKDPYIYVYPTSRNNTEGSIDLKVAAIDTHKVIVDGKYYIKIFDDEGNEITSPNIRESYTGSNTISLENLDLQKSTSVKIYYTTNTLNSSSEDKLVNKVKTYIIRPVNNNGISVGEVYAATNLTDRSKVNLVFSESLKLDLIKQIKYTIMKDGESVLSYDPVENFVPSASACGTNTCYTYTLQSIINSTGIYQIQIQFFEADGNLVDEITVEYTYTI